VACFPGWRRRDKGGGGAGECCLQASSSLRWCFSPASAVESWSFELEVGTGASSPWSGDVAIGLLLLQGYGACFRVGGRWPAGSEPTFPRRDGDRHWRAQIQELEGAGRCPGRLATADDFFNFDSSQSQRAMGLLQLKGCWSSSPVTVAGGEEGGQRRFAEDPGAYL